MRPRNRLDPARVLEGAFIGRANGYVSIRGEWLIGGRGREGACYSIRYPSSWDRVRKVARG